MIGLTKFSLKRPVTLILALVTVLFFGLRSVMSSPVELTPDMDFPMMVVTTVYAGASPADVDELISKKIEAQVSTLSGIKVVKIWNSVLQEEQMKICMTMSIQILCRSLRKYPR